MIEQDSCCMADQFCTAAANFEEMTRLRTKCFSCGLKVCSKCSSIRKYLSYGKQRLCNDCQIEHDGNDKVVMKRLYSLAGY